MILQHKLVLTFTRTIHRCRQRRQLVYVLGDGGQFGTVNLSTGSFSSIGPGLPVAAGGLVQGSAGNLFTLGFNGDLNSINPSTGAVSVIRATGLGDCSLPTSPCGLNSANTIGKFGSKLYATDLANNLYSVNPATPSSSSRSDLTAQ
jgi:hypothetical protein